MDKEFQELIAEYLNTRRKRQQEEQAILQKMKENLKKRNGGKDDYWCEYPKCVISIENAGYEDLLKIDGDMNRNTAKDSMTKTAELAREQLLKLNKNKPDKQN